MLIPTLRIPGMAHPGIFIPLNKKRDRIKQVSLQCGEQDLNLHVSQHMDLNHACLPVPTSPQVDNNISIPNKFVNRLAYIFRLRSSCNDSYVRHTKRAGRPIRARCLMRVLPSGKTRVGGNAIMSFKHR